jgi:hypothetical protein
MPGWRRSTSHWSAHRFTASSSCLLSWIDVQLCEKHVGFGNRKAIMHGKETDVLYGEKVKTFRRMIKTLNCFYFGDFSGNYGSSTKDCNPTFETASIA